MRCLMFDSLMLFAGILFCLWCGDDPLVLRVLSLSSLVLKISSRLSGSRIPRSGFYNLPHARVFLWCFGIHDLMQGKHNCTVKQ